MLVLTGIVAQNQYALDTKVGLKLHYVAWKEHSKFMQITGKMQRNMGCIVARHHPWYDPAYEAPPHKHHAARLVTIGGPVPIERVPWPVLRPPPAGLQQDEGTLHPESGLRHALQSLFTVGLRRIGMPWSRDEQLHMHSALLQSS